MPAFDCICFGPVYCRFAHVSCANWVSQVRAAAHVSLAPCKAAFYVRHSISRLESTNSSTVASWLSLSTHGRAVCAEAAGYASSARTRKSLPHAAFGYAAPDSELCDRGCTNAFHVACIRKKGLKTDTCVTPPSPGSRRRCSSCCQVPKRCRCAHSGGMVRSTSPWATEALIWENATLPSMAWAARGAVTGRCDPHAAA
jgi:hypothetical protein